MTPPRPTPEGALHERIARRLCQLAHLEMERPPRLAALECVPPDERERWLDNAEALLLEFGAEIAAVRVAPEGGEAPPQTLDLPVILERTAHRGYGSDAVADIRALVAEIEQWRLYAARGVRLGAAAKLGRWRPHGELPERVRCREDMPERAWEIRDSLVACENLFDRKKLSLELVESIYADLRAARPTPRAAADAVLHDNPNGPCKCGAWHEDGRRWAMSAARQDVPTGQWVIWRSPTKDEAGVIHPQITVANAATALVVRDALNGTRLAPLGGSP